MSISDLYQSGTQQNNVAHFAAIANIASVDGQMNEQEKKMLFKFADKLNIGENIFAEVLANFKDYPIIPVASKEERLEYLFDLFKMIFADHTIDEEESKLIHRYAMELGCSSDNADELIAKSVKIFNGEIEFEDYKYFIEKN